MGFESDVGYKLGASEDIRAPFDPQARDLIGLIAKVCDLPEREEKWALLKTLNEILLLAAHPPMVISSTTPISSVRSL